MIMLCQTYPKICTTESREESFHTFWLILRHFKELTYTISPKCNVNKEKEELDEKHSLILTPPFFHRTYIRFLK